MTKKQKLSALITLRTYIQSPEFQEFVMQPILKDLEKIQKLKEYKSWDEVLKAQGKEEGLLKLKEILKANELEIENIKFELEN